MRYPPIVATSAVAMITCLATACADVTDEQPRSTPRRVFEASVTAYCDAGTTDDGSRTRRGTAAADPRRLPFGSEIGLEGLNNGYDGPYVVHDSGREIKGTDVDIFIPDCAKAKRFGRQHARVRVVRFGSNEHAPQ